jgi:hypothetical protein
MVDPEWIDIQVVRNWISTCDHQHGQSCRCAYGTIRITQHRPNLPSDTWGKGLTKAASEESYVALSYGWGSTPNLTTVQVNVELFQQPGSLDREEIAWQIPTCIRDAIAFTVLLNERYLWVDSLCIVLYSTRRQENLPHREIVWTASIYANTTLTIVAANEKTPITACEALKWYHFQEGTLNARPNFQMALLLWRITS